MVFTEADNQAIARTELDTVLFQTLAYDATTPGIATASTGTLFHQIPNWDRDAYIFEVNKGSGLFPAIGEIQTVPQTLPIVANKKIVQIQDYANSIDISKDLFDDNLHGVWAYNVRDFALKARVSQDLYNFGVYRNAFTTELTADGVPFISASHPLIGGGTTSNLLTGALSDTLINNMIIALRQQVDQANVVLGGVPKALLVSPTNFKLALQLTDSALVADTANNAINVYRSTYGFQVYTSPYFSAAGSIGGSNTAVIMLSDNHTVTRVIRQGIETFLRPWGYSNNRTYNYQANFREKSFAGDYAGAVGSTGV